MRCLALAVAVATCVTTPAVAGQAARPQPIFRFETDRFWLNLHHFLYVLGRAQAKMPDASRDAVRAAPADAERGLARLTAVERQTWSEVVTLYSTSFSQADLVFDRAASAQVAALASARDALPANDARLDPRARAALERAAPLYRKAWWSDHRTGNNRWRSDVQALVDRHGPTVLSNVTRVYGLPWPRDGYPVYLSAYSQWAGAYSTADFVLVMATNPAAASGGLAGLETSFHEGMHQWDADVDRVLARLAPQGTRVPTDLFHALIFYTAGNAVRRVVPSHTPTGDVAGVWRRGLGPFRAAIEDLWQPYLDGRGTRDEALTAILVRTTAQPLFTFEVDEFWLNLHHFLYMQGQAHEPGARQPALAAAREVQEAMPRLSADEQRSWTAAADRYAAGLSRESSLAPAMMGPTTALAGADDAPTLERVAMDRALATTLESVAPIYRRVWWPAHRAANRTRRGELGLQLDQHGKSVVDFVTKAYGQTWPTGGYPVHLSGYANFGGAYSGGNNVLVVSSLNPDMRGTQGLETVLHESMHQWDQRTARLLRDAAKAPNNRVPPDLPHALIWVTAGEAVRRADSTHRVLTDILGIWDLRLSGATVPARRLKAPLEEHWVPYLNGRGTRDEALAALMAAVNAIDSR